MRPLKRPMFKYGGDVKKQGIMHGMNGLREGGVATTMADATMMAGGGRVPFANGGTYVKNPDGTLRPSKGVFSSDFNKGVYNADGTPITIPKRNFFEDASFVFNPLTKLKVASMLTKGGIRGGKEAISGGLGSLKNFFKGPVPARKAGEVQNRLVTTEKAPFLSDKFFGQYIRGPYQSTKKAFTDAFGPAAGSIKDYKTAIGLGIPTTGFGAYKMYQGYKDRQKGSKAPPPPPGEGDRGNVPDAIKNPPKTQAEIDAEIKANEDKKLNKIYSLLGVDRAKKNAAAKALADMSRYIDEGGKDTISRKNIGSTLTKGILAFDKRLDKVDQLKEAAGLMMAKGEIEKDIYKEKGNASTQQLNALSKASGKSLEYVANAKLGIANSPAEAKAQLAKLKNVALTSDSVTAVIQQYADENGIKFQKQYTTDQKNDKVGKGKEYATVVDLVEDLKLDPKGSNDGLYVIGTSIVEVEKGVAKLTG